MVIQAVPISANGDLLFIKNAIVKEKQLYLDYKLAGKDEIFKTVRAHIVDNNTNVLIVSDDDTPLYVMPKRFLDNILK